MLVCKNIECEAYKDNTCIRCVKYKEALNDGWKDVTLDKLIHTRSTKTKCEFFMPNSIAEITELPDKVCTKC